MLTDFIEEYSPFISTNFDLMKVKPRQKKPAYPISTPQANHISSQSQTTSVFAVTKNPYIKKCISTKMVRSDQRKVATDKGNVFKKSWLVHTVGGIVGFMIGASFMK